MKQHWTYEAFWTKEKGVGKALIFARPGENGPHVAIGLTEL